VYGIMQGFAPSLPATELTKEKYPKKDISIGILT
jgi:hypothetical protein